jgi:hypothetical protein
MIVDLRDGTLKMTTASTVSTLTEENNNADAEMAMGMQMEANTTTTTNINRHALLPFSRDLEISLRTSLRPMLFSLDTLGGYDSFLVQSTPMLSRRTKRDDVKTKEHELLAIVQHHMSNVFQRPLAKYSLTLYELERSTSILNNSVKHAPGNREKDCEEEDKTLNNIPQTLSFFAEDFLRNLSRRSSSVDNFEEDDNPDVVFYAKLFKTRLWYQWLSEC